MKNPFTIAISLLLTFISSFSSIAQENNEEGTQEEAPTGKKKRFQIGLYVGSYFANKYTSHVYDGYGYDLGGKPNNFENSFMNNKINIQYSGRSNGQPDYIAEALGVQPGDWFLLTESDMPVNMRYNVAFLVGGTGRLAVSDNGAILLNVNASKLSVSGNFTLSTKPNSNSNQLQKTVHTFSIKGGEQRIMFQAGYQHLAGDAAEEGKAKNRRTEFVVLSN